MECPGVLRPLAARVHFKVEFHLRHVLWVGEANLASTLPVLRLRGLGDSPSPGNRALELSGPGPWASAVPSLKAFQRMEAHFRSLQLSTMLKTPSIFASLAATFEVPKPALLLLANDGVSTAYEYYYRNTTLELLEKYLDAGR